MSRPQPGWVRSIIPWCYSNAGPVKAELDRRLGANRYKLSTQHGHFVVHATRRLDSTEIDEIYEKVYVHYHPT
ncbi:hypothetical protein LX36DRAFT_655047 [Colletotrichum falcatum]|nr:hypothetical protein LX36DRAFT_655047 [Colletotrichum falcatum]